MSEKRGETEKLKFDFNQAHALEIKHKVLGWYRVTSRDFRSFDGPRRTVAPEKVVQGRVEFPNDNDSIPWTTLLLGNKHRTRISRF
jgi:hypothetical protein